MSIRRRLPDGSLIRIPHEVAARGGAAIEDWLRERAPEPAPEPEPIEADEED